MVNIFEELEKWKFNLPVKRAKELISMCREALKKKICNAEHYDNITCNKERLCFHCKKLEEVLGDNSQ